MTETLTGQRLKECIAAADDLAATTQDYRVREIHRDTANALRELQQFRERIATMMKEPTP